MDHEAALNASGTAQALSDERARAELNPKLKRSEPDGYSSVGITSRHREGSSNPESRLLARQALLAAFGAELPHAGFLNTSVVPTAHHAAYRLTRGSIRTRARKNGGLHLEPHPARMATNAIESSEVFILKLPELVGKSPNSVLPSPKPQQLPFGPTSLI